MLKTKRRSTTSKFHKKCLKATQKELFNLYHHLDSPKYRIIVMIGFGCLLLLCMILIVKTISNSFVDNQRRDDIIQALLHDDPDIIQPISNKLQINNSIQIPDDQQDEDLYYKQAKEEDLYIEETEDTIQKTEYISITTNWGKIWHSIKDINIKIKSKTNKNKPDKRMVDAEKTKRAKQIHSAFTFAWNNYAKYALGHDGINPIDGNANDVWGGLGATLIDSLDTLILMGHLKGYKLAINTLKNISFDTDLKASFFETTIRHLGGLIGAYNMNEMIRIKSKEKEYYEYKNILLSKATSLADKLFKSFSTGSGIPKSMINLQTGEISNYGWTGGKSVLAEVGSNQLEFYAMSQYTNNSKYFEKSFNVYQLLDKAHSRSKSKLYPRLLDPESVTFSSNYYTLGGMSDSFYEYLLKLWVLTHYENKLAIKMYVQSINAANEQLLRIVYDKDRREQPYYFYGDQSGGSFSGKMEELVCFMPGVLALGAYHATLRNTYDSPLSEYEKQLIKDKDKHLKLAHVLVESCYSLFNEMDTGLAPESIYFNDNSWGPNERKYQLRPETIESLFILYSVTGDEQYREWGWNIFTSIETNCKTEYAYSGLKDVTNKGSYDNQMQSFVFAETFKYLYLLFDAKVAALIPLDEYVFNTEAHLIHINK
eukprot:297496_1